MLPPQVNLISFKCDSLTISCCPWSKEIKTGDSAPSPPTVDSGTVENQPPKPASMVYPLVDMMSTSSAGVAASNEV
jgi:hypothetical protein